MRRIMLGSLLTLTALFLIGCSDFILSSISAGLDELIALTLARPFRRGWGNSDPALELREDLELDLEAARRDD